MQPRREAVETPAPPPARADSVLRTRTLWGTSVHILSDFTDLETASGGPIAASPQRLRIASEHIVRFRTVGESVPIDRVSETRRFRNSAAFGMYSGICPCPACQRIELWLRDATTAIHARQPQSKAHAFSRGLRRRASADAIGNGTDCSAAWCGASLNVRSDSRRPLEDKPLFAVPGGQAESVRALHRHVVDHVLGRLLFAPSLDQSLRRGDGVDDQPRTARSLRLGERRPLRTLVSQGNV